MDLLGKKQVDSEHGAFTVILMAPEAGAGEILLRGGHDSMRLQTTLKKAIGFYDNLPVSKLRGIISIYSGQKANLCSLVQWGEQPNLLDKTDLGFASADRLKSLSGKYPHHARYLNEMNIFNDRQGYLDNIKCRVRDYHDRQSKKSGHDIGMERSIDQWFMESWNDHDQRNVIFYPAYLERCISRERTLDKHCIVDRMIHPDEGDPFLVGGKLPIELQHYVTSGVCETHKKLKPREIPYQSKLHGYNLVREACNLSPAAELPHLH